MPALLQVTDRQVVAVDGMSLRRSHDRRLDEAVFAAYGWPNDLSDDEILARLLELNLERAGG